MKLRVIICAIAMIAVHNIVSEACQFPPLDPQTIHSWRPESPDAPARTFFWSPQDTFGQSQK